MWFFLTAVQLAAAGPGSYSAPDTLALSPVEREAALRAGEARAAREAPVDGAPSAIHGEVGVAVGSHGGRAAWGTAAVPLGSSGQASFSVAQERFDARPR